jgi:hypothetical protein
VITLKIFKNANEISNAFQLNGWDKDTTFEEVTMEEAEIRGLLFAVSEIKAGRKIFKMNVTGNIYNQSGDLLMYNISIARDPDSPIKFPVVKNVIKGCMSKYDIDEITFFVGEDIKFSGSYERFMQTSQYDQSPELFEMRNQMLNSECLKSQVFNGHKLYLLLPENKKINALEELMKGDD